MTPGVQGDGLWRYQHVLGEFVAVPLCSSTLLLLGVSRLARDARLDARPRELGLKKNGHVVYRVSGPGEFQKLVFGVLDLPKQV